MLDSEVKDSEVKDNERLWDIFSYVLLAITLALTLYISYSYFAFSKRVNRDYFNELVNETEAEILKRYDLYELALQGGLGLFKASNAVDRQEWAQYVDTVYSQNNLPGISGLGFIEHVMEDDLDGFLKKTSQERGDTFKNHPETSYKDKFVIKYIVPERSNQKALGLDIGHEVNRREAAETAISSGKTALTKRIQLVQDNKQRAGFLMLVPFFKGELHVFEGWIYAPFIGDNFFSDLNTGRSKQVAFNVYDGKKINPDEIIYQGVGKPLHKDLTVTRSIDVAGQIWTIEFTPSQDFHQQASSNLSFVILGLGVIFSIFVYLFVFSLIKQKKIVSQIVAVKTRHLTDKNKTLEEFSSIAAHDLKEPIRNIASIIEIVKMDFAKKLPKEVVESLDKIFNQAIRMNDLVSDLLSYSLSGSAENTIEKIDLKELIEDQMLLCQKDSIQLSVTIDETIPNIMSSEDKMAMIYRNLISNAIKYNDNNDIKVECGYKLGNKKGQVILFIKDNGIGIASEHKDRIFKIFKRLHQKTKYGGGTGIGLSIVHQAIKSLDENIWVESVEGQGTTFFFTSQTAK